MALSIPSPDPNPAITRDLPEIGRRLAGTSMALAMSLALVACGGDASRDGAASQPTPASTEPLAVETPPPEYPLEFACAGVGGEVVLVVQIGATGTPDDVRVEYTSRQAQLDTAAVAAVRNWRFKPATSRGQAVPTKIRVPVKFTPPPIKPDLCFALEEEQRRAK